MTVSKQDQRAVTFFYENAGYSWNPAAGETQEQGRERCAVALANAERWASVEGYSTEWQVDQHASPREWRDDDLDYPVWCAVLRDPQGEVVASLGAIDFGPDGDPWGAPYRRVVEAELALEAMPE